MKRIIALLAAVIACMSVGGTRASAITPSGAYDITGLDLHDGMIFQSGGLFIMVGTQYGCPPTPGFQFESVPTHWCGFATSTAPSLDGPWTTPVLLFPPSSNDPFRNLTWDQVCSAGGDGCFNPRLVQRPDGVWVLWFNSPSDYITLNANGYDVMGCNSPTGPCGPTAGPPFGSFNKPHAYTCGAADGDFSIVTNVAQAYLECTGSDRAAYVEPLDIWWANGVGGGVGPMFSNVESPGAYHDTASGKWVSTLSYPECAYCAGTGTIYMTAPTPLGPWTSPSNAGVLNDPVQYARATLSGSSCGGQPRTIDLLDLGDGVRRPYQQFDLWLGTRNETNATTHLEPLTYLNPSGSAGDGRPWLAFKQLGCD